MTKAELNKMSQDLNVILQYTIYVLNILGILTAKQNQVSAYYFPNTSADTATKV